ncbi:YfhO family protein [Kitasatospora kazusensis]|uniref:YfhO family protein n=1 Tax=Kitasatospora kazusensis TaxID=407974 RepID=UPI0031D8DF41
MSRTAAAARRRLRSPETRAAALAAALPTAAYCLASAFHGTYPFGGRSRAVGDLGDRFVPFHAHLWDLQHGTATGDLLFNWNSGYGSPFLADFLAYLANPFSWLVGLFPRAAVNLPVFLVTLLSIGLASALMTVFLGRLHPGPPWLRALLAAGYGGCAWVLEDGAPAPMWMWGLVSLPLVCLAFDRCLAERRWAAGTLLVAAAWAGNLHTGTMAVLGAGLVLLTRVFLARTTVRARLRVLGRSAAMAATGALLAAPVIVVGYQAGKEAQPARVAHYAGAPGVAEYLAQLLPGGRPDHPLPNVFVGVPALLLVASLPFNRRVRVRERAAWYLLLAAVAASFTWTPAIMLWHGLALPNGSPYRAAFVLSGMLVIAAWVSLAHRPDAFALLGGAGLVALVALSARGQHSVGSATWVLAAAGAALVAGAFLAVRRRPDDPAVRRIVGAALAAGVLAGSVYAAYRAAVLRDGPPAPRTVTTAGARPLAAYGLIRRADDWPGSRTDPGPHEFTGNDPLLLGGEGGAYDSAHVPAVTAQLLHDLGAGWTLSGRHTLSPADPVGRALFGVTTYLDPAPGGFAAGRATAAPLVTVHPASRPGTSSVWARQESLLGTAVYEVPKLAPAAGPAPTLHGTSGWSIPATPEGGAGTVFAGVCTPGSTAYFYGPWFAGTVAGLGTAFESQGLQPATAMPVRELGTVPADGAVRLLLRAGSAAQVPVQPVGCLAPGALDAALGRLRGAVSVRAGGHGIEAVLPPGSAGTALVSVPAVRGWRCSVDGRAEAPPTPLLGMVSLPLGAGATRLSCTYRTPGLDTGLAVGGAALAVLAGAAVAGRVRVRPGPGLRPPAGRAEESRATFRAEDGPCPEEER